MENEEIMQYLDIIKMKIADISRDIENIKSRLQAGTGARADASKSANAQAITLNFFTALTADDDNTPPVRQLSKYMQCPHN